MPKYTTYNLTAKGYDRVEAGLPYKLSNYFSVLGAIADLEEKHSGAKAYTRYEIEEVLGEPRKSILHILKRLIRDGLVEVVTIGDEPVRGGQ